MLDKFILKCYANTFLKADAHRGRVPIACENIRFFSLFAAGDVSRNVPIGEERGETDVFAG